MSRPYQRRVDAVCQACGVTRPKEGNVPDPCLGLLPGVRNACCGHGSRWRAYVQEGTPETGITVVRGDEAMERMVELGGEPAEFQTDLPEWPGWVPRT